MLPALPAALPRLVPRGVRPAREELLALRRYGAAMRSVLALDDERRDHARAGARSHGMEYAESRPYSPGDDVRRIDWRVTARTGRAHTKVFRLDRSRDLFCLVDQRASMRFGTRAAFKSVVAAEIAALCGWAAVAGADRFGALAWDASVRGIRSGAAESSSAALCTALAANQADSDRDGEASLDSVAARATDEAARGARFVVVSDFADSDAILTRAVNVLRARGFVILVWVLDPVEEKLLPPGRYPLTDGRAHLVLDTSADGVRATHAQEFSERRLRLARYAFDAGTRCHVVRTGEPLFAALARPFPSQA